MGKSIFNGAHEGWQDFNGPRGGLKFHLRKIAFLFSCSFVVCGLFFAISNPPVVVFLLFLDVIWGAVFLCTKRSKNRAFLHSCVGISLASACALCAVKLAWGHSPRYPTIWEGILLGLALLIHLFALWTPETTAIESDLPKLYPRRKYDYERVKMYVSNFSMVGINAPWGTGKSFVVDQLKRDPDFLKEFDLISIDLLTCDLDQVERIIIEELDKVFRKHYIHSAHSFRLKGLMGKNQWSNLLWGILGNEGEGIAASLQGFQKELRKLDKKILLIFDDLDRISETNSSFNLFTRFDNKIRILTTVSLRLATNCRSLPTSCQLELANCNLPLSSNSQSCLSRVPEILSLYNEPTISQLEVLFMEINYKKLGKRIQSARRETGLSQEQLAEAIGKSPSAVSTIETGKRGASLETLVHIANVLQVSADYLLADQLPHIPWEPSRKSLFFFRNCEEWELSLLQEVAHCIHAGLRRRFR